MGNSMEKLGVNIEQAYENAAKVYIKKRCLGTRTY